MMIVIIIQSQKDKSEPSSYEHSVNKRLRFNKKSDVDYLNAQISLFNDGVSRSDSEANSTDRGLASQLILITTVLITANIVVFSNGELMKILTLDQKIISITGSNLLILSLFFGIMYYAVTKRFHTSWANARNSIVNNIADGNVQTRVQIDVLINELNKKLRPQIKSYYLVLQIVFLALALLAYLALTTSLLLNVQFKDIGEFLKPVWQLLTL